MDFKGGFRTLFHCGIIFILIYIFLTSRLAVIFISMTNYEPRATFSGCIPSRKYTK